MRWLFFSPIVFLIYGGINFYIGKRLLAFIRYFFPAAKSITFWIPFAFLCVILIFANFFHHNLNFMRKAGSIWIAVFMYLFMLMAASELVRLGLFLAGKKIPNIDFFIVGSVMAVCAGLIVYGIIHAHSIKIVNYEITINKHDTHIEDIHIKDIHIEDMKIALISDLHIGSAIGVPYIKRLVDKVNSTQADIVCLAGDIFDGNLKGIKDPDGIIRELKRINAPLGVYACLGNHDVDRMSLSGAKTEPIEAILNAANIMVLQDEVHKLSENVVIAGRRDARPIGMNAGRKTPHELFASEQIVTGLLANELFANFRGVKIVLDHQPTQFPQLEQAGADLVLCGHTHSGQLFPSTLITKAIFKKAGAVSYGYWKGDNMQAVVTSGAAYWGPPVRIGTDSEVAVIRVVF